ncbi:MAG TPA: hypothetical protein VG458_05140, partial [Solirubrobacterales bacterium]|nr:hypothetical protein [Solirubrobacterales bacterium]
EKVSGQVQEELTKSFASAATTAEQYPQYAPQIIHAARESFLNGGDETYIAGMAAIALGIAVIFFLFPKQQDENEMVERFHAEDTAAAPSA